MPLFRSGDEQFRRALDLVHRGEFEKAGPRFAEASERLRKEGLIGEANLAAVYARLVELRPGAVSPPRVRELAQTLRQMGPLVVSSGAREIPGAQLAAELELTAASLEYEAAARSGRSSPDARAQSLQYLTAGFRQLGDVVLFLPEFFGQGSTPAASRVPYYAALSEEALGESQQSHDPLGAAEHFQAAQSWWQQVGDTPRAAACAARVGHLALRAKCWFCGREGSGHGIQFVSLPVGPEATSLVSPNASPLPSIDGTGRSLFACKACCTSISALADRVAQQRVAELDQKIQQQLRQLAAGLRPLTGT